VTSYTKGNIEGIETRTAKIVRRELLNDVFTGFFPLQLFRKRVSAKKSRTYLYILRMMIMWSC